MFFNAKTIAAGVMMAALAAVGGCSSHSDGPGGPEVVQAGYPVDNTYYDQGGYQGDYWVWHDGNGHQYREARADHERRANMPSDHRAGDVQHRDAGNDHRDVAQPNHPQGQNMAHGDAHQVTPAHGPTDSEHGEAGHEGHAGGDAAAAHDDAAGNDRR